MLRISSYHARYRELWRSPFALLSVPASYGWFNNWSLRACSSLYWVESLDLSWQQGGSVFFPQFSRRWVSQDRSRTPTESRLISPCLGSLYLFLCSPGASSA